MSESRRDTPPTLSVHGGLRPRSPSEALEPGRAPVRPRNQRHDRKQSRKVSSAVRFLSGTLTLALVVFIGLVAISSIMVHQFEKPGPLAITQTVSVPKGEGRIEIARRLEREGVIANRWAFVAGYLFQAGWRTRAGMDLKAGEYEFQQGVSMREVLEKLIAGKSVLYKITIPEGLTSQQIVERINAEPNLSGTIETVPKEGTLLPDTFSFSKNVNRNDLLQRLSAEQAKVMDALWENRKPDLPIATKQDALILASIVEKETGRAEERDRVAGVFVNRLRKKMRLQSDPTIIYGIVKGQGRLERPLTKKDIAEETPYNTYRIDGLPPEPICNPGRAAIEATLNPAETDAIYFVADGTGGHKFSKTLKQHNAAVAQWRKIERQRRQEEAQNADLASLVDDQDPSAIPNPPASDAVVLPIATEAPEAAPESTKASEPLKGLRASTVPLPIRRPEQQ